MSADRRSTGSSETERRTHQSARVLTAAFFPLVSQWRLAMLILLVRHCHAGSKGCAGADDSQRPLITAAVQRPASSPNA